jgi:predicted secreted protein
MRKILPTALLLLAPLLVSCSSNTAKSSARVQAPLAANSLPNFQSVLAKLGGKFSVNIQSTPSAGKDWIPLFDKEVISLNKQSCDYGTPNPSPGSACVHTFEFNALKQGTTTLKLNSILRGKPDPNGEIREYRVTIR